MRLHTTALALAAAVCLGAPAQAGSSITVKADRYLDVASGRMISPAVLIVQDGRIAEINPATPPKTDATIELPGLTLLPGLMDAHTHLTSQLGPGWANAAVTKTGPDMALFGAVNAERTLFAGFTTVRNLGASHFADVALANAVDSGMLPGPHIIASAHATGITGGHCDDTGYAPGVLPSGPEQGIADSADEFVKAIRYQVKYGAKVVKICATAGVLSHEASVGAQQPSFEELKAAAEEAHRHGLKIAAHTVGEEGIIAAATAGVDSIEHASMLMPKAAAVIKERGVYVVHTLYLLTVVNPEALPPVMRPKAYAIRDSSMESFKLALKQNLKIVFGTDAGVFTHGNNAKEFYIRTQLGQSPLEAVRSATLYASALLDVPERGQIKPGLLADVIAVEGDPLSDIRTLEHVRFVMKEGRVYKEPTPAKP